MIKRILVTLIPAFLVLPQMGCRTCNCIDGDISFFFTGYTNAELGNLVVKAYTPGSNFGVLTDSTMHIAETDYRLERRGDSIYLNPSNGGLKLRRGKEYRIELPVANRIYQINDIRFLQVRDNCNGKSICINPVQSLRINSTILEGPFPGLPGFALRK